MSFIFRITLLSCLFISFGSAGTFAQETASEDTKGGASLLKLRKARHLFLNNDIRGALQIYEELYRENSSNTTVNFRLGEAHVYMKNFETALPFLVKAYSQNKDEDIDLPLVLGRAYHRTGKLDEAISAFNDVLANKKQSKENIEDATRYLAQVNSAKALMERPVPVKISNMGDRINSSFDEYGPSVSADGKTLTFTSRRPDTKGGQVDINDQKFYEDIYIAEWNEEDNNWDYAKPVPGRLNTEFHDAALSISPDGKQIFLYKNIDPKRSGDIYVSKVNPQGSWGSPQALPKPVNTSYFESSASLSADGKWLYFVSEKKGGHGLGDIYRSKRISRSEWGEPENLGPIVNTEEDEISAFIHPDGKTLFFSSKGHNSMGGYDVFRTVYENGSWSKPENLGYPINTLGDDLHFTLSADNLAAYYSNVKPDGMGGRDIYRIDLSEYAVLEKDFKRVKGTGLSILRGNIIDSEAAQAVEVEIKITDPDGATVTTSSNSEGEYFITLKGGREYKLVLDMPGFEGIEEKVFLPEDERSTFTLVKHFVVDRKNKTMNAQ